MKPGLQSKSVLYVTTLAPNRTSGFGLRTTNLIEALGTMTNSVDVIVLADEKETSGRAGRRSATSQASKATTRLLTFAISGLPYSTVGTGSADLASRMGDYDLIWFSRLRTWVAAGRPSGKNVVVDLDDLSDQLHLTQRQLRPGGIVGSAWKVFDEMNSRRFIALREAATERVGAVAVCSPDDAAIVDSPNCFVVPNGTDLSVPVSPLSDQPRLLFVGPLSYLPNLDAATTVSVDLLPEIRSAIPNAEAWLVGSVGRNRVPLTPGVKSLGFVEDLDQIYASVSTSLIPLRAGAGTRLKVLETLARGVPLVATPFAVAGLGLTDGEQVLLGRNNRELVDQSIGLLTSGNDRQLLGKKGRLWAMENAGWDRAEHAVRAMLQSCLK